MHASISDNLADARTRSAQRARSLHRRVCNARGRQALLPLTLQTGSSAAKARFFFFMQSFLIADL